MKAIHNSNRSRKGKAVDNAPPTPEEALEQEAEALLAEKERLDAEALDLERQIEAQHRQIAVKEQFIAAQERFLLAAEKILNRRNLSPEKKVKLVLAEKRKLDEACA